MFFNLLTSKSLRDINNKFNKHKFEFNNLKLFVTLFESDIFIVISRRNRKKQIILCFVAIKNNINLLNTIITFKKNEYKLIKN